MLKITKPKKRQAVLEDAVKGGVVLPSRYYSRDHSSELSAVAKSATKMAAVDQIVAVLDALENALGKARTWQEFKQLAATSNWELPAWRVDLTLRNGMQQAYQTGAWRNYERYKFVRPFLMYSAINDSRVRPNHLALDGVIKSVDDEFWNTYAPPNGHNCRCSLRSLTKEQADKYGGVTKNRDIPPEAGPDPGWDKHPLGDRREHMAKLEKGKSDYLRDRLKRANQRIKELGL